MSKDYRFQKEELDDIEQQDWLVGKYRHDAMSQKASQSKAEIARKKRESKRMSYERANLTAEFNDKH
ncbi:hypothetical protein [Brumicola blandensis]|uniref:Uncharacterized protein n=1 Tax=Brumicola blandensis TaxID=3075611 RepID=A0AAW8QZ14_9ALTE|nr:hypothetical protein [Alteromonas sp. W409]MDT0581183.1 hypothetical protein [Alteromonas sp. W409]